MTSTTIKETSSRNDITLKSIGITRDQSSQWQQLAKIPELEFEQRLAHAQTHRTIEEQSPLV